MLTNKKWQKIIYRLLFTIGLLFFVAWISIRIPYVNKLIMDALLTSSLNSQEDFEVDLSFISFDIAGVVSLKDVYIIDRQKDTILYSHQVNISVDKSELIFNSNWQAQKVEFVDSRLWLNKHFWKNTNQSLLDDLRLYANRLPQQVVFTRLQTSLDHPSMSSHINLNYAEVGLSNTMTSNVFSLIDYAVIESGKAEVLTYDTLLLGNDHLNLKELSYKQILNPNSQLDIANEYIYDALHSLEDIYIDKKITVHNFSSTDRTTQQLFSIDALNIESDISDDRQHSTFNIDAELYGMVLKTKCSKEPVLSNISQQRRKINLSLGDSKLNATYVLGHETSKLVNLHINEVYIHPSIAKLPFAFVHQLPLDLDNLHFKGHWKNRTHWIEAVIVDLDSLDGFHLNMAIKKDKLKTQFNLDTLSLYISDFNLAYLYSFWGNVIPHLPYKFNGMHLLQMKGNSAGDSTYNFYLTMDSIVLQEQHKKLRPIVIEHYQSHIQKTKMTRHLWNINQQFSAVKIGDSKFTSFLARYKQNQDLFQNDSIYATAYYQENRKAMHLDGFIKHRDNVDSFGIFMHIFMDSIRLTDFYKIDYSYKSVLVSTEGNVQVQKEGGILDIEGRLHHTTFQKANTPPLSIPSVGYLIQLADQGNLYTLNMGNDNYSLWSNKVSLDKLLSRVKYQYQSLLKDSLRFDKQLSDIDSSELFELTIKAENIDTVLHFLGYGNVSLGSVRSHLKVKGYDFESFIETNNFRYNDYYAQGMSLMFNANERGFNFDAESDLLFSSNRDDSVARNLSLKLISDDKVNIDVSLNVDLLDNRRLDLVGKLASIDHNLSYFSMQQFLLDMGKESWKLQPKEQNTSLDAFSKFTISSGNQKIIIRPLYYKWQESMDILIETTKVRIGFLNDILFKPTFSAEGLATLKIKIYNKSDGFRISTYGKIEQLMYNSSLFGDFELYQQYKEKKMQLSIYDKNNDMLRLKSLFTFYPSVKYQLLINAHKLPLDWMNDYINPNIQQVQGIGGGNVVIDYDKQSDKLKINGKAYIEEGQFGINFTNCNYVLSKTPIIFKDDKITFKDVILFENNKPYASSKVSVDLQQKNAFNSTAFTLTAEVDKMLVFDTVVPGYEDYKVNLRSSGNIYIRKKSNEISVYSNLAVSDTSSFIISKGGKGKTQSDIFQSNQISIGQGEQFIVTNTVASKSLDQNKQPKKKENLKVNFFSQLEVDNNLKVHFYADAQKATNEFIEVLGRGNLFFSFDNDYKVEIDGEYQITKMLPISMGYLLVKLKPGLVSKLVWQGDVNPELDIHTYSQINNVDFSSLYTSIGSTSEQLNLLSSNNVFSFRSDVDLLIDITGSGLEPKTKFDVILPSTSPLLVSQNLRLFLNRFRSNEDFANKEVGYLMLFNRFLGNNQEAQNNFASTAFAGALSSVTTFLLDKSIGNDIVQKTIDKVLPGQNIKFNINSNFSSSDETANTQSLIDKGNINVSLSKSFLSDRLILSIGSSFDYSLNNTTATVTQRTANSQITTTPSVDLRWKVRPKSNLFMGLYYKNAISTQDRALNTNQQNSTNIVGLNIGIAKEFNSFADFFKRSKSKKNDSSILAARRQKILNKKLQKMNRMEKGKRE